MNNRTVDNSVQARMKGIRRDIDHDIEDVSASAHKMVDWKGYVASHPWACLGAAAALGFLAAPRRPAATVAAAATPIGPAAPESPAAAVSSTLTRGLFDAFVTIVVSVTVREAIAYLGQRAEAILTRENNHGRAADVPE